MIRQLSRTIKTFPTQFWFLCIGLLVSVGGIGLVWPFLTIYLREQLDISMMQVTTLIAIESFMTMISTLSVGPIMDRFGRKWVMIISLFVNGGTFFFFTLSTSYVHFLILMVIRGLLAPLFRVGTNTMVADLVPEKKRLDAYSILRTAGNLGYSIGPAVGGFLAARSFNLSFYIAMSVLLTIALAAFIFLKESLPKSGEAKNRPAVSMVGYGVILKDKFFRTFLIADTFVKMAMVMMFVLLSAYAKENFGVLENQYGFIMTVNATLAIILQWPATRFCRRRRPTSMLMLGAFFYGVGLISVAFGSQFFHFVISMVIMTVGEVILMPIATNLVSELAPEDQRGRYMGLYSLTIGIAKGISPVFGGILNDQIAPAAIWYGGGLMGFVSVMIFFILGRMRMEQRNQTGEAQKAAG